MISQSSSRLHANGVGVGACGCVTALLALAGCLLGDAASAASLEELQACLTANVPERSSALAVKLSSSQRGGAESKLEGRIFWRRSPEGLSESLICMSDPPDVRGLAYLISEGDSRVSLWGYLPEQRRVMHIHAKAAARRARIARTAISSDDLRYLPVNLGDAEVLEATNRLVGDRKVSVVRLSLPSGEDAPYDKVVAYVDDESCVPLRTEFYESGERLLKVVRADPNSITQEGSIHVARSLRVEDRKDQVRTAVRVERIEIDGALTDGMFVPSSLQRNVCQ
jgi:hypothetical protein